MRRVVFAVAGLLIGAAPASAQYVPRPVIPIGPMAAEDVADIVQAMGLDPLGQPMRSGPFFVQRARDDFGRVLQVTVDARRSQVMAIEAVGAPRRPYGTYAGYGPHRRYHPGYAGLPDDDAALAPPRSVMAPHGLPPQSPHAVAAPHAAAPPPKAQPQRPVKSAAVPPSRPPVPRKRPAAAPEQASAGSVEPVAPVQAAPAQSAPPPAETAPPPAAAPAAPANPAVTPVTPLE